MGNLFRMLKAIGDYIMALGKLTASLILFAFCLFIFLLIVKLPI